jgi:pilus assembly protein CpaB
MKQKNLILMVVAVGCGLVAAFLTSQMSAKPNVDKVDVIVAAKDLPIGMQLTKDDLKTAVKRKSISRDSVPPTAVETEEELLEKRLTRTVHADEMINKGDVTNRGVVSIPPGMSMVALPIGLPQAVAGFVLPGSKVDVLASVRLQEKVRVLPILVNMLVLAVDSSTQTPKEGAAYQNLSTVSFAVNRNQALLIKLAQARNCDMSLLLRNQEEKENENDREYKIEEVTRLLQDNKHPNELKNPDGDTVVGPPKPESTTPKTEIVKVPAAIEEIAADTQITADLIAEKFKVIELPKDLAMDAVTDLSALAADKQVLRTGLGKGQWVTKSLFGSAEPKAPPREEFTLPKPGPNETPKTNEKAIRDVSLHTASGTRIYRYQEAAPGEWKLLGEVNPNHKPAEKPKTEPTPEKVD